MKLVYLYHSGFVLSGEGITVVMDYFEDSCSEDKGVFHEELLHREGRLYVLSSHFHADHFNPKILEWQARRPDCVYILSRDIWKHRKNARGDGVVWLREGECYADDMLKVRAFGSTDAGVSFLLEIEGKRIFHAGDLNNWHWMDESDEAEWRGYENHFLRELDNIAEYVRELDVAMFPVDPRLGSEYMRGPLQFAEKIKTRIFVPMHFDDAYDKASAFAPAVAGLGVQVPLLRQRGQWIDLNLE